MMDVRTWVEKQRASHARQDQEEARRLAALSAEQRGELLASLCASAFRVLNALPPDEQRRALEWRDPLPAESVVALARLRKAYRGKPGGR
jgi:hypothetical protein